MAHTHTHTHRCDRSGPIEDDKLSLESCFYFLSLASCERQFFFNWTVVRVIERKKLTDSLREGENFPVTGLNVCPQFNRKQPVPWMNQLFYILINIWLYVEHRRQVRVHPIESFKFINLIWVNLIVNLSTGISEFASELQALSQSHGWTRGSVCRLFVQKEKIGGFKPNGFQSSVDAIDYFCQSTVTIFVKRQWGDSIEILVQVLATIKSFWL